MQIPCVYIPGPAPAVSVANSNKEIMFFLPLSADTYTDPSAECSYLTVHKQKPVEVKMLSNVPQCHKLVK
jgi:hypothetical protein